MKKKIFLTQFLSYSDLSTAMEPLLRNMSKCYGTTDKGWKIWNLQFSPKFIICERALEPDSRSYAARHRALQIFLDLADESSKRNIVI